MVDPASLAPTKVNSGKYLVFVVVPDQDDPGLGSLDHAPEVYHFAWTDGRVGHEGLFLHFEAGLFELRPDQPAQRCQCRRTRDSRTDSHDALEIGIGPVTTEGREVSCVCRLLGPFAADTTPEGYRGHEAEREYDHPRRDDHAHRGPAARVLR